VKFLSNLIFLMLISFSNLWAVNNLNQFVIDKEGQTDELDREQYQMIKDKNYDLGSMDFSVDENTYYIGPGDNFMVSFISRPSIYYKGTIDQNGNLYLVGLGLIKLGKITLKDAMQKITEYIGTMQKSKNDIYVAITRIKNASVYINGGVHSPGLHEIPANMRLLDCLKYSNNDQLPSLNEYDYRNIQCSLKDTVKKYDLLRYILKGDLSQNPYVYPGDIISITKASKKVHLYGSVNSIVTGEIPIKSGETIGEFLSLFTFDESADTSKVFLLTKTENGERKHLEIGLKEKFEYILKDRDAITIPQKKNYPENLNALVIGEVASPGNYPILKEKMTAKDLIECAGGISEFGNLDRGVIIRKEKSFLNGSNTSSNNDVSKIYAIRPEMSSAMSTTSFANDFAVIKLKDNIDIKVENADQIYIPKKEKYVYVSGGVKKPGGYEYSSGKNKLYYIHLAGGLNRNADKTNIYAVTRYADVMQTTDGREIQEGDVIVVPISQQNKQLSTVILPILQTVATIAGVVLAIYATTKN
jgi:polysaccharide export outer membrane protein